MTREENIVLFYIQIKIYSTDHTPSVSGRRGHNVM